MTEIIQGTRLVFVRNVQEKSSDGHRMGLYICLCGNEKITQIRYVNTGVTKSCGCFALETARKHNLKHGYRFKPEYMCWVGLKARCTPGNKDFHRYGALGISVCDEWKKSFQAFISHIGPRPSGMTSVDRIDWKRGYEPGNVRWANPHIQARNRKDIKRVSTIKHGVIDLVDYAKILGITLGAAHLRLKRGKLEGLSV